MQLYHLDWEKSSARSRDDHFKIISPLAADDRTFVRKLFDEGELYELVATSDADDIEEVYKATQNGVVSDSWSLDPPSIISPTEPNFHAGPDGKKYGRRSTSMGDIIVKDGKVLLCATMGFQEI